MIEGIIEKDVRQLTTPRAAAIAGILFGLLFSTSLILIRLALPADIVAGTEWVEKGAKHITLALTLMPFSGIAFLWFIGVVRDKLGKFEDQFFSTVFFGSSLLFLAMIFTSMAVAGAILAFARSGVNQASITGIIYFGRVLMFQISNVYALRMAGVFMISLGTIWLRTGLMPRWLALITYLLALLLLVAINLSLWITLVFPIWVFAISSMLLVMDNRKKI